MPLGHGFLVFLLIESADCLPSLPLHSHEHAVDTRGAGPGDLSSSHKSSM